MAKEDYNVADRDVDFVPATAGDRADEVAQETPDADARDHAETNGVSNAAYANYATALAAHEARDDIEPLSARRAREIGEFADQDFMRTPAYNEDGTAADAPRPGTVHGDADKNEA